MSTDHQIIRGHCGCGLLRYTIDVSHIERDLGLSAYCHCSSCQRLNGAPFVWTTHWEFNAVRWDPPAGEGAPLPPGAPGSSSAASNSAPDSIRDDTEGAHSSSWHSPNMQTFESMKGRKWKLRCRHCGSPLGSWNARTTRWTIWPTTMERKSTTTASRGPNNDGGYDIPDEILAQIKPRHHQFYGPWRTIDMHDKVDKWTGYEGKSDRVDAVGDKEK